MSEFNMDKSRILFVSSEIAPYLQYEDSPIGIRVREIIEGMYDRGHETRNFMPKYGYINERRHQLHEVIRLSGINIIVNGSDQPLVIKVASIPQIRVQVYFIDSEEFFARKSSFWDETGALYPDNDERLLFFCKGVLDSVKKLGWAPDIIFCAGWFSSLVPYYVKTQLHDNPLFADSKVVFAVFDEDKFSGHIGERFVEKAMDFPEAEVPAWLENATDFEALTSCAAHYSDAVVLFESDKRRYLRNAQEVKDRIFTPHEGEMVPDYMERVFSTVLQDHSVYSESK
jgi:starch synthase